LTLQFDIVCSVITFALCAVFQKTLHAYQFGNKQTVHKTEIKLNSSINVYSRPQSTKFQRKSFSSLVDEKVKQTDGERDKKQGTTSQLYLCYMHDITIDLQEIGREGVDRIELAQDRDKWRDLVKAAINVWVP